MATFIDLGCGVGNFLERYAKKHTVIGIDIDPQNIQICKEKIPNGSWYLQDISSVNFQLFPPADTLFCIEVLEHVPNWEATVENLRRAPSQTGLYLTVPYEKSEKKLLSIHPNYWKEIGHVNFFQGDEIKTLLEKNGFEKIKIQKKNAALYFELKRLFKKQAPCIRNTYYQNILSLPEKVFWQLFRTDLFKTKLKYVFPLWMFTLPISWFLDHFWGATIVITAKKK